MLNPGAGKFKLRERLSRENKPQSPDSPNRSPIRPFSPPQHPLRCRAWGTRNDRLMYQFTLITGSIDGGNRNAGKRTSGGEDAILTGPGAKMLDGSSRQSKGHRAVFLVQNLVLPARPVLIVDNPSKHIELILV